MIVQAMMNQLQLTLIAGQKGLQKDITTGYVGDLLSNVIAHAKEGSVWITVQGHLNIVAVASLIHLSCIIVVQDIPIPFDTIKKANEEQIPIFTTSDSSYKIVQKLLKIGIGD